MEQYAKGIFSKKTLLITFISSALFCSPVYAKLVDKPAGSGVAIIAVSEVSNADSENIKRAVEALKSKGFDVKLATPSAGSNATLSAIANQSSVGVITGSASSIASSYPGAFAYGDEFALSIANNLDNQKSNPNGAFDINGNVAAMADISSDGILKNVTASISKMTGSVPTALQSPTEAALSEADIALMEQLELAGVDPRVAVMPFPADFRRSAGRYGEWRSSDAYPSTGRYHAGWDFSTIGGSRPQLKWMGLVSSARSRDNLSNATGHALYATRLNGDQYYYFHMTKSVRGCVSREHWPKQIGDPLCSSVGNSGKGIGAVHLHAGYSVSPKDHHNRRRNAWLPDKRNYRSMFSGRRELRQIRPGADGAQYNTDLTPYLSHDMTVKTDKYTPWIGSTMRQQFNALYGTRLPTGADDPANLWPTASWDGVRRIRSNNLKPITNLPAWGDYEWTPDQVAAARSGTIKGVYSGDIPSGMYMMSPMMLASFLKDSDGAGFGSLPQLAESPDISKQSARQIIKTIGGQRYGNSDWNKAMVGLSTKAMMSEYAAMDAAENYITQQNFLVQQRIEMLLATMIRTRAEPLHGRVENIHEMATADIVPNVINTKVTPIYGGYYGGNSLPVDMTNLPDDIQSLYTTMLEVISAAESRGNYDAYNTGTAGKIRACFGNVSKGCLLPSTMTIGQIIDNAKTYKTSDLRRTFATGKYQITYKNMEYAISVTPGVSLSTVYSPDVQDLLVNTYPLKKKPDLARLFSGASYDIDAAQLDVAKEWASIGVPAGVKCASHTKSDGYRTYYDKDGVNTANHSRAKTDTVRAILTKVVAIHRGENVNTEPANP